ncbi:MAG: protein-glutamate O-methyltransferase [Alphaproteobacteria bacterium]|nr:protein-glutamate O-methyltransferase [Alphaproteobacteria bacterium]MBL7098434.1 protein-glutamate O-methyltransferase [Alphaproteobacteria bacterium]
MIPSNFEFMAALLKEKSGLIITADKIYLLDARLSPIARKHNLAGLDALVMAMRAPLATALVNEVVDAMTTNETSFFRDKTPFDALKNSLIPGLVARRAAQRSIRIWSAACSTGQEPYSLVMMLRDQFPALKDWRIEIVATDLSPTVLQRARDGVFTPFEVQRGLPIQMLVRHFDQVEQNWQIKPDLRRMIDFRPLNLLSDISALGKFDIILCRNVLIYFDQLTKGTVLSRMARMLPADGALILGGAESVFGICDALGDVPGLRGVYGPAPGMKTVQRPEFQQQQVLIAS